MKVMQRRHSRHRYRFWILLPAILMILFDVGVTLLFQPPEYWRSNYDLTTEKSPFGIILLRFHPAAFLAYIFIYIVVIAFLVFWLSTPWHKITALAVVVGHTAGVFSWLGHRIYWEMIVIFIVIAAVTVYSWQRAESRR
jgi:hypothetical protein